MVVGRQSGRYKAGLKRGLGLWEATIYGIGIILGAGVYALIGEGIALAGNSVWLSFAFAAVVAALTGLSYMELITIFPRAAAEYTYVKHAFRNRLLAFNIGWMEIFAGVVANTTVAMGFAGYLNVLTGFPIILGAACLIVVMSIINFWGIEESARLNTVFTLIETSGLAIVIILAIYLGRIGTVNYLDMPNGITGTLSAASLIFFAYLGFQEMANISEESKNPRKILPKALLYAVVITTIIYILVGLSVVSLVGWQEVASSKAPLAFAVSSVIGDEAFIIMSLIALFATSNTVLIGTIVCSRMMYGMAADGSLPVHLCRIHKHRRTPWVAILATMVLSIGFLFVGHLKTIASVTDMSVFYTFVFVNAAVIFLRYRMPKTKRSFVVPISIGKLPLLPVLGLVSSVLLALHLPADAMIIGTVIILAGVLAYWILEKVYCNGRLRKSFKIRK
jgi:basic amino acid/polyamine antiporter, APA family